MARFDQPIEPMTLGNMRELGVRSLDVSCWNCPPGAALSASDRSNLGTIPRHDFLESFAQDNEPAGGSRIAAS